VSSTVDDIQQTLDSHLAEFMAAGEDLACEHEFIANFIGFDDVLRLAYDELVGLGCKGDPPDGGGWIYMHVERSLTRESVIQLARQLDDVARRTGCLFELLDVRLNESMADGGKLVVLGVAGDVDTFRRA
jgi:hypothetical protein